MYEVRPRPLGPPRAQTPVVGRSRGLRVSCPSPSSRLQGRLRPQADATPRSDKATGQPDVRKRSPACVRQAQGCLPSARGSLADTFSGQVHDHHQDRRLKGCGAATRQERKARRQGPSCKGSCREGAGQRPAHAALTRRKRVVVGRQRTERSAWRAGHNARRCRRSPTAGARRRADRSAHCYRGSGRGEPH